MSSTPHLRRTLFGWVVLAALAAGCDVNHSGPGRRSQSLGLTEQQELSLGEQAYAQVLKENRGKIEPNDSRNTQRVRRIAERIIKATNSELLRREINLHFDPQKMDWQFCVIDDPQVNAFCLPGGKVAVYSRILPVAANDDQLATVLGHEIAHALAHHASERVARDNKFNHIRDLIGRSLGGLPREQRDRLIGLLGAGAKAGSLAYDRQQEAEADHIGVFLMTFADFDPDEAVRFWERMKERAGAGHTPEILSDHPSDEHRIAALRGWAIRARAAREAWKAGRVMKDSRSGS